jgi:hypothetical protein
MTIDALSEAGRLKTELPPADLIIHGIYDQ